MMNEAIASSGEQVISRRGPRGTVAAVPKLSGSGYYLMLLRQHLQRRARSPWLLVSAVVRTPHVRCNRIVTGSTPRRNVGT